MLQSWRFGCSSTPTASSREHFGKVKSKGALVYEKFDLDGTSDLQYKDQAQLIRTPREFLVLVAICRVKNQVSSSPHLPVTEPIIIIQCHSRWQTSLPPCERRE
ncbi:hypothetical protein H2248_008236 [Termitomyces sp. 'cryptogamus']|nr:hypothetical protein H2248_008236 [Termitomyces sp. 'cryptogamus']